MSADMFDILMVIALGALAGMGIALIIGFFARIQKREWSAMNQNQKTLQVALVILFCGICIAGLGYYFLIVPEM
jgi:CDP-diglyceride synthetase